MRPHMRTVKKKDIYWKVKLVCMKVQAHSSYEPPLEYNQDQTPLTNQDSLWPFLILEVTEVLCSFRLFLEGKTGKDIPLSDAKDSTSGRLKRGGVAGLLLLEHY